MTEAIDRSNFAGQLRDAGLKAISAARGVFGNVPLFSQAEGALLSERFAETVKQVITDSGVAAIPVEFVVTNLDQLKQDLGMGNGVISKAIDQARQFNPANSDANRFQESGKTEVHYHVEDMNEAIRLENLRQRKQAMSMRR